LQNWWSIAFFLLAEGKIKSGTNLKRHQKWVVHSKLAWKVQFSPLIFHIILIRSLEFVAIQFWYKIFIFIIFQSLVQEKRERYHQVQVLREKVIIHIMFYHQNSCYLCLYAMRWAWWWLFRASTLPKKDLNQGRQIQPILISCFWIVFWVFWVDELVSKCSKGVGKVILG